MVQIIPRTNPTFGEQIASGLDSGVQQGLDFAKMAFKNSMDQKSKSAEFSRKMGLAKDYQKKFVDQGMDAQTAELLGAEMSGLVTGGSVKSLINAKREQSENSFLSNLLGVNQTGENVTEQGEGTQQSSFPEQTKNPSIPGFESEDSGDSVQPKEKSSGLKALSDAQLDMLLAKGGKSAELGKSEKTRRLEEQKMGFKKSENLKKDVRESFKANQTFIDKTYDQYEDSLRKDAIISKMDELEESGETSESGIINLLESLGLKPEWLKNPKNEEYTKLGLDLLGGGTLQADYGSRVLASEFKVSQQRIPTLMQTKEGRKQISENIKALLLPAKLKKERMQFYIDQSERTGQPLPHDLRGKILKDIKPQLEEVYDKFKQRNGRYKVSDGTYPDDNALEKYYYLSNGDDESAIKMMKQDGYDVS